MKMLLKNRKTLKITTVEAAQKRKLARGPLDARLPRAQGTAWAWAEKSARARLTLGPNVADRRRPLLAVGSDPTAGRVPRGIKTRPAPAPRNPRTFSLSPFSLHAKQRRPRRRRPWRPRRRRGWRRHRPPRRRARSAHAEARRRRVAWRRCPEPARARASSVPDDERRSPSGPRPSERRRGTFPRSGGRRCWRRTVSTRRPLL